MDWARIAGVCIGLSWLGGCSLTIFDRTPCETHADCGAFPEASVCGGDGYCEMPPEGFCEEPIDCRRSVGFGATCVEGACVDVEPVARCGGRALPEDLFDDLEAHRDRVVFGMIMDEGVEAHRRREDSVELAITQINSQRGIDGRLFGVVFCDVQGAPEGPHDDGLARPDAAVATARFLVETLGVPGIIGPAGSGDTTRVFTEVVRDAGGATVQITPSGTSPALTDLDPPGASDEMPGLLWRSAPSAAQQGELVAQHMAARNDPMIRRVAIIHEEASFGEGVAAAFGERWGAGGDDYEYALFGYEAGNRAELMTQVAEVGARLGDYDALFVLGQVDEMTVFVTAATDDPAYPDDIPVYFGDTGVNAEIFQGAASDRLFDNVLAATAAIPESFVFDSYRNSFMMRYGADPADSTFTANAYDAAWLMALGATWATFQGDGLELDGGEREIDGLNIARGLRKTFGGDTEITFITTVWPSGVSQFRSGEAIDVTGSSGNHDFDLASEEATGPTVLLQASADLTFTEVLRSE